MFRKFDMFGIESNSFSETDLNKINPENLNRTSRQYKLKKYNKNKKSKELLINPRKFLVTISPNGYLEGIDNFIFGNPNKDDLNNLKKSGLSKTINNSTKEMDHTVLHLQTQCKVPIKDLVLKLTTKNETGVDIRVYDIVLTINPKVLRSTLEIVTNAQEPVVQEIPVPNSNNFDVSIKQSFEIIRGEREEFEVFTGKFKIKKKGIHMVPIRFTPNWIYPPGERAKAKLVLFNQQTNEKFIFDIFAQSKEPLSKDHINVSSNINEIMKVNIPLANPSSKTLEYFVECNIPDANYEKRVAIKAKSTSNYLITFSKSMGGEFSHIVKFFLKDKTYIWYLITAIVEGSNVIEIKDEISTIIRYKILIKQFP